MFKKQSARIETKAAEIASEFGRDLATRWFGAEIVASLPTYVRGPKAGLPKGWVVWDKAIVGGWDNGAGVLRPNDILRIRIAGHRYAFTSDDSVVWYKANRESEPGPCNAARASGYGRQLMERESFESAVRWMGEMADENATAFEMALADGHPAAVEAKRRMNTSAD